MIEEGKRNPEKIRISTPGLQTTSSFNVMIIEGLTGARYTQDPYKDIVAGVTETLGGQVEATTQSPETVTALARKMGLRK